MRWALVADGTVQNVVLWDGQAPYDPGSYELVELDDESPVGPGWAYDGAMFTAPAQPE